MAYRMVYLRVRCNGCDPGASGGADLTAFKAESRRLFQDLVWTLREGRSGVCDTVTKDRQDLYLDLSDEEYRNMLEQIVEQIEDAVPHVVDLANELTKYPKPHEHGMQL